MRISKLAKKMMAVVGAASAVFMIAGVAYFRSSESLPFVLGVALGALLNVAKIVLLEYSVDKSLTLEKSSAKNLLRLFYFLRFLLTGGLLALAATSPAINLWGTMAGIITLQIAAFAMKYFHREDEPADAGESLGK